jgi:hypothetical protein
MGIVGPATSGGAGFFGQAPGESAIRVRDREPAAVAAPSSLALYCGPCGLAGEVAPLGVPVAPVALLKLLGGEMNPTAARAEAAGSHSRSMR